MQSVMKAMKKYDIMGNLRESERVLYCRGKNSIGLKMRRYQVQKELRYLFGTGKERESRYYF